MKVALRLADRDLLDRLQIEIDRDGDIERVSSGADVLVIDRGGLSGVPSGAIIVLVGEPAPDFDAAVSAALPEGIGTREIVAAVRLAAAGMSVRPRQASTDPDEEAGTGTAPRLTGREVEVLELLAAGASNKEIARRLGISVHTVKFHIGAILAKLGASGRLDAVGIALRTGLVML